MSKNNARNLAAASALFKLYETQDVIKVCSFRSFMKIFLLLGILPLKTYGNYLDYFFDYLQVTRRDDSKLWIAYSNIQGKSNSLKEKQGEGGDPDLKPSMDAEGNVIPIAEEADKWVLKVCEEIINEYKDQFTLEELIFGPGMFESLVRLIIFKNCLPMTQCIRL